MFLVVLVNARRHIHWIRIGGIVGAEPRTAVIVLSAVLAVTVALVRSSDLIRPAESTPTTTTTTPPPPAAAEPLQAKALMLSPVLANTDLVWESTTKGGEPAAAAAAPPGVCSEGRAVRVIVRPRVAPSSCPSGFALGRGGFCVSRGGGETRVVQAVCRDGRPPLAGLCPAPCPAGWTPSATSCILCKK